MTNGGGFALSYPPEMTSARPWLSACAGVLKFNQMNKV